MIEAVGHEHLPPYFGTIGRMLRPGGRAVIQAICTPDERWARGAWGVRGGSVARGAWGLRTGRGVGAEDRGLRGLVTRGTGARVLEGASLR